MISIINYGAGNTGSVKNALNYLRFDNIITSDKDFAFGTEYLFSLSHTYITYLNYDPSLEYGPVKTKIKEAFTGKGIKLSSNAKVLKIIIEFPDKSKETWWEILDSPKGYRILNTSTKLKVYNS